MGAIDQYVFLIGASLVVIVSFLFNVIAKKTNVPSVLMLIALGVVITLVFDRLDLHIPGIDQILKILGVVGLIMIVLEAALDLELKKEKWGVIWKSFSVALLALVGQTFLIAVVFQIFFDLELPIAMAYAIPLAIMSSAIVLPSVGGLSEGKKEFMIYEATFSDILGIIFFYSLLGNLNVTETTDVVMGVSGNILITIVVSVVLSYGLAYVFHRITTGVKLFLLIAVLILLYAIGKQFHLSSLIIILTFGLVVNNYQVFFRGKLTRWFEEEKMKTVLHELHLVTGETAFVVRTFFFVVFGMSISLAALLDLQVAVISVVLILGLYLSRGLLLRLFLGKRIFPEIYLSPRGLITILLFYSLLPQPFFDEALGKQMSGILLFVIIASSIIMTIALVKNGKIIPAKERFMTDEERAFMEDLDEVKEIAEEQRPNDLGSTDPDLPDQV